jgi:hypothetical protein
VHGDVEINSHLRIRILVHEYGGGEICFKISGRFDHCEDNLYLYHMWRVSILWSGKAERTHIMLAYQLPSKQMHTLKTRLHDRKRLAGHNPPTLETDPKKINE